MSGERREQRLLRPQLAVHPALHRPGGRCGAGVVDRHPQVALRAPRPLEDLDLPAAQLDERPRAAEPAAEPRELRVLEKREHARQGADALGLCDHLARLAAGVGGDGRGDGCPARAHQHASDRDGDERARTLAAGERRAHLLDEGAAAPVAVVGADVDDGLGAAGGAEAGSDGGVGADGRLIAAQHDRRLRLGEDRRVEGRGEDLEHAAQPLGDGGVGVGDDGDRGHALRRLSLLPAESVC